MNYVDPSVLFTDTQPYKLWCALIILVVDNWHLEQPNGYNYTTNRKHNLVFLMLGIKKFSRRLIKGETYMGSVTDVLNRVASYPHILEIDDENGEIDMKLVEEEEDLLPSTSCPKSWKAFIQLYSRWYQ